METHNKSRSVWDPVKEMMSTNIVHLGPEMKDLFFNKPNELLSTLIFYKFALKMVGKNKKVIDWNCKEGLGTWILAKECGHAIGLDQDTEKLAIAKKNWNNNENIDFQKLNLDEIQDNDIDAIVINSSSDGPDVNTLKSNIKKYGIIIIKVNKMPEKNYNHFRDYFAQTFIFSEFNESISPGLNHSAKSWIIVSYKNGNIL